MIKNRSNVGLMSSQTSTSSQIYQEVKPYDSQIGIKEPNNSLHKQMLLRCLNLHGLQSPSGLNGLILFVTQQHKQSTFFQNCTVPENNHTSSTEGFLFYNPSPRKIPV